MKLAGNLPWRWLNSSRSSAVARRSHASPSRSAPCLAPVWLAPVRLAPVWLAALLLSSLGSGPGLAWGQTNSLESVAEVDFSSQIAPLLKSRCQSCHGAENQEGGLRLDIRRRVLEGGDGGPVIVPGKAAESRLVRLVSSQDADERMPPAGEGTPLSEAEIGLLRAWIDQGAKWPAESGPAARSKHWSFQPIGDPLPPVVSVPDWVRNPVDQFVLRKLEEAGIHPAPEADRETLIRRLYLDLLGLPPSPEAVDQFVSDRSPTAYESLVERVLASPHFGERWGRHWLDLARYADSDGYEKDRPRPFAWRYREWVLNALNRDMPYDQFSILQLAGDMLPGSELPPRVASGFHRNTLHNTEGGTDKEEDRVKKTVDRTNTLGAIWLGLTVGCAQCHTHKYDPLTHREYYSLYAFFNNIDEQDVAAPLPLEQERYERAARQHESELSGRRQALADYERGPLAAGQPAWESRTRAMRSSWHPVQVSEAEAVHATLEVREDGTLLAQGPNRLSERYTIRGQTSLPRLSAVRLEVVPDDGLPAKGPGRAKNGNFVLHSLTARVLTAGGESGSARSLAWKAARADFAQDKFPVTAAAGLQDGKGWAVSPQLGKRHVAVFEAAESIELPAEAILEIVLDQTFTGEPHNLGKFRLTVSDQAAAELEDSVPAAVAQLLQVPQDQRTEAQRQELFSFYREQDKGWSELKKAVDAVAAQAPKPPETKAQSVVERAQPREARVHLRGDFLRPGPPVSADVPEVLATLTPLRSVGGESEAADRLELARWLFQPEHPLTARVTVNRIWARVFGRGLVATVDDFGTQGQPPSHPLLLDWLATRFRDDGWSVKLLLRRIVTSATYRQSSHYRPELRDVDPDNVLLARGHRGRVEAEIIRDIALTTSGLLDPRLGGPSVRPPQPAEYSSLTYANSARWKVSDGGDRYRRGLYTFFQRTSPYPMLVTFDSPDANQCAAARSSSNTPIQALTLWNDPVFFEVARAAAHRAMREVGYRGEASGPPQIAERLFRLCLSRRPTPTELETVTSLYQRQLEICRQEGSAAAEIAGSAPADVSLAAPERAAWTVVARSLTNLDEYVTRE